MAINISKERASKGGPEPRRVKLNKPWAKAVGEALKKERPAQGWQDQATANPKKKKPA